MFRALPFPVSTERSRNKDRIEASLAGLCELERLKQRQESLVLSALSLEDVVPGRPAWGDPQLPRPTHEAASRGQDDLALRRQLNSLQCTPWGLMATLEQQVGDLRVDAERSLVEPLSDIGDSRHSSDAFVASRDGIQDSATRTMVPRSLSAPYPSLEGITEGTTEEDPWQWESTDHVEGEEEGEPTAEDYQQAHRVETYILGLVQRSLPMRPCKPRTSLGPEARGVTRQSSLCRKETPFAPEYHGTTAVAPTWASHGLDKENYGSMALSPEDQSPARYTKPRQAALVTVHSTSLDFPCGAADPSSSEAESPQHFQSYPIPHSLSSDEQLVNAQYIPAQPCRAPNRSSTQRPVVAHKSGHNAHSPERAPAKQRGVTKKCRFSEERPANRKPGRKACRSQSENSLLGQRIPERKYNTVERDGSRGTQPKTKRTPPGSTNYRRWRSTLELSQDEAEGPGEQISRRARKSRPGPPSYSYSHSASHHSHHHHHHHHHPEYMERAPLCRPDNGYTHPVPGESESSLSEAESPGSSSLSSDSDESGGLVWPQQLPPQLAPASPPAQSGAPLQPKAFVKIKASHALKKKILRFRTGSLKVMTTV
ncbi:dapper 1 isoform X2 [Denticeps clupeoides]|uniref:dapper 1 isoform X2 n=1 Tax=Denticeps clupeoides TaxID=299321 RepID=UPI0010A5778A|nr:dapper homolog 3 isoform X2 [Denticeps clupeoides]